MKGIILILLWFPALAYSQIKVADKAYDELRYADAIYGYTEAMKKGSLPAQALLKLASSYDKTQQYQKSLNCYEQMNNDSMSIAARYRYAQLLAINGRYQEAARQYQQSNPDDQTKQTITLYEQGASALRKDSAMWTTALLNINSGYADFSPVPYGAGLVFVSDRPERIFIKAANGWNGGSYLTLYRITDTARVKDASLRTRELEQVLSYANKDKKNHDSDPQTSGDSKTIATNPQYNFKQVPNQLSPEMVFPFNTKLNKKYHVGPVSFNRTYDTIIVTYNNQIRAKGKGNISRLRMKTMVMKNGDWITIAEFPFNNDAYSVGHPALHPNGQVLFFTSDMPGGMGGKDLYYCLRKDTGWGPPINAGPMINTSGDEMFPYIAPDGTLYFSSDKWPGLGGLDLFIVRLDENYKAVSAAVNIGAPFNSSHNDFGILVEPDSNKGYFSSDRRGNDDIYSFVRKSRIDK
ncbi:PD40 domain-containing protein [Chitinophaga silvisoli]|uniref:Flagellar motor protein MotB n=1 Tax=Chitinophaga silvisoli TaxID=2291814 RepID=A0A3E1NYS9_9BACT|nr:PD40 domain-containing protein [Chitinophaga silvisoli]RFM33079.1 hypothetical protein DXN04_18765 [Chitinophaga silvisoli]